MLGFSTTAELRLAVWAAIALSIAGLLLYGKYEKERADGIVAKDNAARSEQDTRDLQLAQDTIRDLRNQLGTLKGAAPAVISSPPPRIRVCVPTGSVRPEVASAGTQPAQPTDSGVGRGVLPGGFGSVIGEGGDIGSGVRAIAAACEVLATYHGELWNWSVAQAK